MRTPLLDCSVQRYSLTCNPFQHSALRFIPFGRIRADLCRKVALRLAYAWGFWLARLSSRRGGAAQ